MDNNNNNLTVAYSDYNLFNNLTMNESLAAMDSLQFAAFDCTLEDCCYYPPAMATIIKCGVGYAYPPFESSQPQELYEITGYWLNGYVTSGVVFGGWD